MLKEIEKKSNYNTYGHLIPQFQKAYGNAFQQIHGCEILL